MGNVIVGTSEAIEQPIERAFTPGQGVRTIRRWKGDKASISAKAVEMESCGYATRTREGPWWELDAEISLDVTNGGGETVVDTWELGGSASEKELMSADIWQVNDLDPEDAATLRDFFDGKKDVSKYPDGPAFLDVGGDPSLIFNLLVAGMKSQKIYAPTLKHTQSVSRAYSIPASVADVGAVLSSNYLLSKELVWPSIAAILPTASTKTKPAVCGESATITLHYGWLKAFPTVTATAWNKAQILQEWEWGLWPETYTYKA